MDLVILAGGMGSRFGGLKQVEPVGENGEFIIDYSIYDAIKAGFDRVVFIIKKEHYDLFRETVGKRVESKIEVAYAFQDLDKIPAYFTVPEGRVKPWGTGHAILCCKNVVKDNFAIINADDFYGRDAFFKAKYLLDYVTDYQAGLIAYNVGNTLTENGATKRGVCRIENGMLESIVESAVGKYHDEIVANPLGTDAYFTLKPDTPVSMNMWCFSPKIFDILTEEFPLFLENNLNINPLKCEFLLPDVVQNAISQHKMQVLTLGTNSKWLGVTFKEDKQKVVDGIKALTDAGEYPAALWADSKNV